MWEIVTAVDEIYVAPPPPPSQYPKLRGEHPPQGSPQVNVGRKWAVG